MTVRIVSGNPAAKDKMSDPTTTDSDFAVVNESTSWPSTPLVPNGFGGRGNAERKRSAVSSVGALRVAIGAGFARLMAGRRFVALAAFLTLVAVLTFFNGLFMAFELLRILFFAVDFAFFGADFFDVFAFLEGFFAIDI
jgi:hypothetical protein